MGDSNAVLEQKSGAIAAEDSCLLSLARDQVQFKVISKIRASLDLNEILQTTIQEIRQLLNVDRVGVVRLDPGEGWDEGVFIAETVLPSFDSVLAARVRDHCFGQQYAEAYKNGRIQAIDDIYEAGLSKCHIDILSQFQVRANLLVPLVQGDELWGLLCIHQCSGPRQWQSDEIEFVSKLAVHLGVAIQHSELLSTTQQQAAAINQTLDNLKSAHVQLAQAEKMAGLGQLAAGVAHEINNPVSFIKGNLKHIDSYVKDLVTMVKLYQVHCPADIPEIQAAAETIDTAFLVEDLPCLFASMQAGSSRISEIVNSLKTFSRLDETGLKRVDINNSIDDTLLLLKHRLQPTPNRPEIKVQKDFCMGLAIECYPAQINQVLMGLLTNAIDAFDKLWDDPTTLGSTPTLSICTQVTGAELVITIKDNGPGMSETVQKRLYDPFFTTKPVGQGTGLGLAMGYQIIANHNGRLHCASVLGKGSKFSIMLPITQSNRAQQNRGL